MELPAGQAYQILPQIDIVVIIPVMGQADSVPVNFLQKVSQGRRDQRNLKPLSLSFKYLSGRVDGLAELVRIIGSRPGQGKGHEIFFFFRFQGPKTRYT